MILNRIHEPPDTFDVATYLRTQFSDKDNEFLLPKRARRRHAHDGGLVW